MAANSFHGFFRGEDKRFSGCLYVYIKLFLFVFWYFR